MRNMGKIFTTILASLLTTLPGLADESLTASAKAATDVDPSLARERDAAIDRGLDFLAAVQNENGSWSDPRYPALTALPALAFIRSKHPNKDEVIAKAVKHITSMAHPNGAIFTNVEGREGGGLVNYNTAIAIVTLHETGNPELRPYVLKGRDFLKQTQHLDSNDHFQGGWGYDSTATIKREYTDLLNTFYTMEGIALTDSAEESRPKGEPHATVNKAQAVEFIERVHQASADGGFPYAPHENPAGSTTNEHGTVSFNSYGSMTYAGTLALLYADVERDDPRVRESLKWIQDNWSLKQNPGLDQNSLYFYYNVLSKCLNASGMDTIQSRDGLVNWRAELTKELISKQKIERGKGYWANTNNRYLEADRTLVTAYTILALQMAAVRESN